jgi:hypothetical protein
MKETIKDEKEIHLVKQRLIALYQIKKEIEILKVSWQPSHPGYYVVSFRFETSIRTLIIRADKGRFVPEGINNYNSIW